MVKKILGFCKSCAHDLKKLAKLGIAALLITGIALEAPQWHRDWLRSSVGSKVVRIVKVDASGRPLGGGTGFMVKAPSGKKYLLTNAHVCEHTKDKDGTVHVWLPNNTFISRKVVEISDKTDLCLVEPLPQDDALEIAGWVDAGELLSIVGHPQLQPLTINQGEMVGPYTVRILAGIIGFDIEEKDCQKPKNEMLDIQTFFGPLKVCLVKVEAQKTNITSLPGNSGSPVVNKYGNVVGVLFAGGGGDDANWGDIITLHDLNEFLASY